MTAQVTGKILCHVPDRPNAFFITNNACYSQASSHTSATLGRIGKIVVSHAADTVQPTDFDKARALLVLNKQSYLGL